MRAIRNPHEIIIVDNGEIMDVVFSLNELREKYPDVEVPEDV